ncbi:hypothetical protein [Microbacterium sp.]|uniref:hypothetical protein n=1 Tax=Microbacterium sp. TaxID=51671 RepID=UPI0039E3E384
MTGHGRTPSPLTWAQQQYWFIHDVPLPTLDSVKYAVRCTVPPGRSLTDVTDALEWLFRNIEGLRTLLRVDRDGIPRQLVLQPQSPLDIEIVDSALIGASPLEAREALIGDLAGPPMHPATDRPARVGVVVEDGRPQHIVILCNHAVIDEFASRRVADLMTARLFAGRGSAFDSAGNCGPQSCEIADHESGEEMLLRARVALHHADEVLRSLPRAMFPIPAGRTDHDAKPSYHSFRLRSRRLLVLLARIRWETEASAGPTLMTALGIGLHRLGAVSPLGIKINAANRYGIYADAVACTFQEGLATLDLRKAETPSEALRRARASWSSAIACSQYPYFEFLATKARVEAERGHDVRLGCTLDVAVDIDRQASQLSDAQEAGEDTEVSAVSISWRDDFHDAYFSAYMEDGSVVVDVILHRDLCTAATAVTFVKQLPKIVESLMRRDGSPSPDAISDADRATRHAPNLTRVGVTAVDLDALRDRILRFPGVESCELQVKEASSAGERPRIEASVVPRSLAPSLEAELWRAGSRDRSFIVPDFIDADPRGHRMTLSSAAVLVCRENGIVPSGERAFIAAGGRAETAARFARSLGAANIAELSPLDVLRPVPLAYLLSRAAE